MVHFWAYLQLRAANAFIWARRLPLLHTKMRSRLQKFAPRHANFAESGPTSFKRISSYSNRNETLIITFSFLAMKYTYLSLRYIHALVFQPHRSGINITMDWNSISQHIYKDITDDKIIYWISQQIFQP